MATKPHKPNKTLVTKLEKLVKTSNIKASVEDDRDIVFVPRVIPTSPKIDRSSIFPQVQDQGSIGICTGETMTTISEAIENTKRVYVPNTDELSRRYNYFFSRQYDGLVGDTGATPRSMCRSAKNYGIPPESVWPYSLDIDTVPPQSVVDLAKNKRLGQYEVIQINKDDRKGTIAQIESALAEGCLLALAFFCKRWVFYVNGPVGSSGHSQGPMGAQDPLNEIVGGHIVPMYGYDRTLYPESGGAFLIQNSWGTSWGDNGRWSINYMLATAPDFAMEIRVFRGFAGITLAEPASVVLTPAQVAEDKTLLLSLGACTTVNGAFAPVSIPNLHHYVIYSELVKRGRTHTQIGQVLGLSKEDIDGFASHPANTNLIYEWSK
jgi:hypothetical protein